MRFMVDRTSTIGDEQPCDEAVRGPYVRVDERNTNDPTKIPAFRNRSADWWYNEGRNHRVEDGHIKRDLDDQEWFIEINTLDEMLAFIAEHGEVVVGPSLGNPAIPSIEIYDGWRE